MEISAIIGILIPAYIILFILYFIIRHAVEEGTYRAIKRYDEDKNSTQETMIQIGEHVQKERVKEKK